MNTKTKNIILGLVTIIVAVGIYLMYRENQSSDPAVVDLSGQEIVASGSESTAESATTGETKPKASGSSTPKPVTPEMTAAYNLALSNGRKAGLAKEYDKAIAYYNEALGYQKTDIVYADMYIVYAAQSNWAKAESSLDAAIALKPTYTDYWIWKLQIMNEKKGSTFATMRTVYEDGLMKSLKDTKVNLVTGFARIAENKGETTYAISYWEHAKQLLPANAAIYQKEIDRLANK